MSILLALAAAIAYGLSDFLGGLFSRQASPWAIALVAQATGVVALATVAIGFGGSASGTDLLWGAFSGVGSGFGTYWRPYLVRRTKIRDRTTSFPMSM